MLKHRSYSDKFVTPFKTIKEFFVGQAKENRDIVSANELLVNWQVLRILRGPT